MRIIKLAAVVATATAFVGTASAQEAYVNVGVDTLDFDAYGVGAKAGYNFTENFGAEVQGSLGIIDDEETVSGIEADVGYDYLVAAFGTASLPLSDDVSIIGRIGYYYTELSAEGAGVTVTEEFDGLAGGVGLQYMLDEMNGIRVDYTYLDGDGGNADSASLAYVRKF